MAKLYGAWKVTLPGETFTWEPDEMMLSDWATVEDTFGGTFDEWIEAVDVRGARACQVLIWWLRNRKGITVAVDDVDIKIRQLVTEKISNPEGEAAASPSVAATSEPSPDGVGDLAILTP
jgi:hypothetical protein